MSIDDEERANLNQMIVDYTNMASSRLRLEIQAWLTTAYALGDQAGFEKARLKYGDNADFNPIFSKDNDEPGSAPHSASGR